MRHRCYFLGCALVATVLAACVSPLRAQLLGGGRSDDEPIVAEADSTSQDVPLPAEFDDPAFARYVDLVGLGDAIRNLDASAVSDIALQLLEGERILLRNHKSGVTAKSLIAKGAVLAADNGDKDALARLAAAAEKLQDSGLIAQIQAKQKLGGSSRAVDPALIVSVENTDAETLFDLKGWVDVVRVAGSLGDRQALELLKAELPQSNRLSREQQDAIMKHIDETLRATPEPTVDDTLLQKLAGGSRSESDRQAVRDRITGGGWYIVWGKTVAAGEYAELVAAIAASIATGNPGPLYAYFQYLIQENVRKIKQQLPNLSERVITDAVMRAIKGDAIVTLDGVGVKGGIATYRYWHNVTVQVPDGKEKYKIYGPRNPFTGERTWTWGYRPKYRTVTNTIPAEPNNHQPYFGFRFSRQGSGNGTSGSAAPCPRCGGVGRVVKGGFPPRFERCPACGGTGRRS